MAAAAIPLITMAAGAMQQGQKAKAANEQYKNEMTAKAAEQQYSPWTKLSGNEAVQTQPQNVGSSMLGGAAGGLGSGLAGNQQAQQMGGWGAYLGLNGKKDPMAGAQQMGGQAGGYEAPNLYNGGSRWSQA